MLVGIFTNAMKKLGIILCLLTSLTQLDYAATTEITVTKIGKNTMPTADDFIKRLQLEKHIEGGSFKRVYESKNKILIPGYNRERPTGTSIYFLLDGNDFSAFHRLKSDEIWSFNYGSPLTLYVIDDNGKLKKIVLGNSENPVYQTTIFAHQWFAAEVNNKSSFSLVTCFVSPGFEYSDFELADGKALAAQYPSYADLINRLTRKNNK